MTQPIVIPFGAELPRPRARRDAASCAGCGERAQAAAASCNDLEGLVVDVEITDWPTPTGPARGRVIEVLGARGRFRRRCGDGDPQAPSAAGVSGRGARGGARGSAVGCGEVAAKRRDFRGLPIVTIDGETARDFDDAVLVRRGADGTWELQVHIADVAQYVWPGTALDLEARLRGTSVYFPDRAIPMLPMELSTDICSLRPDEDRLVLSCLMRMDAQGEILGYEVCEGVIRSARRMTYTQVAAILDGDQEARAEFAPLVPEFERMLRSGADSEPEAGPARID